MKKKISGSSKNINLIPTLINKAYILAKKSEYTQSLEDLKVIKKLIKDNFKRPYEFSPMPDLIEAMVYLNKGNIDIAYKSINNSLNVARQVYLKSNRNIALIYRTLGEILSKKNRH